MTVTNVTPERTYTSDDLEYVGFRQGERVMYKDGECYVFIKASEELTQYGAVIIAEDGTALEADTTSSASAFGDQVGVVEVTIASGAYGLAKVYGYGTVLANTSCAANTAINTTATGGTLDDDATAGAEVIDGIVLTAAETGGAGSAACFINYPTVGATLS